MVSFQNLVLQLLAEKRGNDRAVAVIVRTVGTVALGKSDIHRIVAGTDQILLDLLTGSLDGGHNCNNGCNTDDNTQHCKERSHLV